MIYRSFPGLHPILEYNKYFDKQNIILKISTSQTFTINAIFELKSFLKDFDYLTLNKVFDYYDDLQGRLGYEPSMNQLWEEILFHESYDHLSEVESSILGEDDPIEWVSSFSESVVQSSSFDDMQGYIAQDFPEYKNDISMHRRFHYCSRDCEGALFLCGNSYYNNNGGVTKCGYITRQYLTVPHECMGSSDLHFSSSDSKSVNNPPKKSKSCRSNKGFSKFN